MQSIKNILINFYNLLTLLVLVVLLPSALLSQPVVKIGNITGCENTEILVPVQISNMENIAALTLYIKVDTNVVDYVGVEDVNEAFSTGEFVGNGDKNNQEIILTWFSTTATNLENGIMCKIRVLLKNGSSNFDFLDRSEFAYPDLTVVDGVEYINGTLNALSSLLPDPVSQTLIEGSNATIVLHDVGEGVLMQWQIKSGNNWVDLSGNETYSGVTADSLFIHSITKEMNESYYRCMLVNEGCSAETVESELLVTPDGIFDNNVQLANRLTVYPNPVHKTLNYRFSNEVLKGEIRLVNINGVMVVSKQLRNVDDGEVLSMNVDDIENGIYLLQFYDNDQLVSLIRVIRN